jgi:hypothetical protein
MPKKIQIVVELDQSQFEDVQAAIGKYNPEGDMPTGKERATGEQIAAWLLKQLAQEVIRHKEADAHRETRKQLREKGWPE